MNRKERRRMSKNLGIMQHQQKLTREEKFDLIRENIISGKEQHKQFMEEVKRRQSMSKEELDSEAIAALAERIAQSQNIPLVDALEEAQKIYKKNERK